MRILAKRVVSLISTNFLSIIVQTQVEAFQLLNPNPIINEAQWLTKTKLKTNFSKLRCPLHGKNGRYAIKGPKVSSLIDSYDSQSSSYNFSLTQLMDEAVLAYYHSNMDVTEPLPQNSMSKLDQLTQVVEKAALLFQEFSEAERTQRVTQLYTQLQTLLSTNLAYSPEVKKPKLPISAFYVQSKKEDDMNQPMSKDDINHQPMSKDDVNYQPMSGTPDPSQSAMPTKTLDSIFEEENELYKIVSSSLRDEKQEIEEEVDVVIVGAGIGGLCAGAILNTLYNKKVYVMDSHYLAGGCAHAFDRLANISENKKLKFTFDSGPTIVLGCSAPPYNPLRQILNVVGLGNEVEWIRYEGWGMIEHPGSNIKEKRWKIELGPDVFEQGPLRNFGGSKAHEQFLELREVTKPLVSGAVDIPAMAMRAGKSSLIPLLRYWKSLTGLIQQGETVTGTFDPFMNGPIFTVTDPWLRSWLDALAFSLSGLPASRTAAAAMAYVLYDMHREGAALDYPKGGLGSVVDTLVKGVEQGSNGSRVFLRQQVDSIDTTPDGTKVVGVTLKNGKVIKAKSGVICNAPVWSLKNLLSGQAQSAINNFLPISKETRPRGPSLVRDNSLPKYTQLMNQCNTAEMTQSFLHLHLALDAQGLDLDSLEAHYTVMDKGLENDPCGELNMIAVSNPCVIDRDLAPEGYIVIHAYGAGNEPFEKWESFDRRSKEYDKLKQERVGVLWRAVEAIIPDARKRAVLELIGSPLTHERFLRRPRGTYGAATEDYLKDGSTPIRGLVLCGDGVFPGIGVPSVALSGASAANSLVGIGQHWKCLDKLKVQGLL